MLIINVFLAIVFTVVVSVDIFFVFRVLAYIIDDNDIIDGDILSCSMTLILLNSILFSAVCCGYCCYALF